MKFKRNERSAFTGRVGSWLILCLCAIVCQSAIGCQVDAESKKTADGSGSSDAKQENVTESVALADLRGLWVRVGDDFQGMVMKIDGPENQLEGRLVHVPAYPAEFGFRIGDVKVKEFARTGGDQLSVKSLHSDNNWQGYKDHVVYTRGKNELLMRQARGEDVSVGAWQRWVRTDASKEKYWIALSAPRSQRRGAAGAATGVSADDSPETSIEDLRAEVGRLEKEGKTNENYALKDFVGTWSREDDDFEGLTMEITAESSTALNGRLVVIPRVAELKGFRNGDIKIRNLTRVGPDEYTVESLTKDGDPNDGWYSDCFVYMRGKNELLFVQAKGEHMSIGAWQSWVRRDETDLQYDTYWLNKGLLAEKERRWKEATTCYQKALKLSPENLLLLNNVAWRLATNPKPDQDPRLAVEYAEAACKKTDFAEGNYLDTLAAAHAAAGDFAKAREIQSRACELVQPTPKDFLERKALYEQNRAFVETDGK